MRANDLTTFLDASIGGGAITAYDVSGSPVNIQLRWAKIDSTTVGGTDTWNLFYQENSTATGNTVAWRNVGTDYQFGANGQMNPLVGNAAARQRDGGRHQSRHRDACARLGRHHAILRYQRHRAGESAVSRTVMPRANCRPCR